MIQYLEHIDIEKTKLNTVFLKHYLCAYKKEILVCVLLFKMASKMAAKEIYFAYFTRFYKLFYLNKIGIPLLPKVFYIRGKSSCRKHNIHSRQPPEQHKIKTRKQHDVNG